MQPIVFAAVRTYRQTNPAAAWKTGGHTGPDMKAEFAFDPPAFVPEVGSRFVGMADGAGDAFFSTDFAFFT